MKKRLHSNEITYFCVYIFFLCECYRVYDFPFYLIKYLKKNYFYFIHRIIITNKLSYAVFLNTGKDYKRIFVNICNNFIIIYLHNNTAPIKSYI